MPACSQYQKLKSLSPFRKVRRRNKQADQSGFPEEDRPAESLFCGTQTYHRTGRLSSSSQTYRRDTYDACPYEGHTSSHHDAFSSQSPIPRPIPGPLKPRGPQRFMLCISVHLRFVVSNVPATRHMYRIKQNKSEKQEQK